MSKKFFLTTKGKSSTVQHELETPVLAMNVRMIDRCLRKAGLRELSELIDANEEGKWIRAAEAAKVFRNALDYFRQNPQVLAFSDLVVEEIPVALAALEAMQGNAHLRLTVIK